MEAGGIFTAAGITITVQIGLFEWLKTDIGTLTDYTDCDERGGVFARDHLSLPFPALAEARTSRARTADPD